MAESEGLTNRKPGAVFTNPQGEKAMFQRLAFFPPDGGAFDAEELAQAIDDIERQIGVEIQFVNSAKTGGFGVAEFQRENGESFYAGRFFRSIQLPYNKNQWKNNELPAGFALQTKATKKESAGYGPSDVLQNLDNQTGDQIYAQIVKKFGADSPLTQAADQVRAGKKKFSIPGDGIQFEAFRDYFCEILHPLAMQTGAYEGNAAEAESIFFKGSSFAKALINFSSSKTNGLYDSLMEQGGRKIKISSKGNGGAAASVSNLSEAVDILAKSPESQPMLRQYASTVEIIQTIKREGQEDGPIVLGEQLKVISSREANSIRALRDSRETYVQMQRQIDQGRKPAWMTRNLENIWNSVGVKVPDKATPFFKMLSGLAKTVGTKINRDTDFGAAAAAILNHSALIQVDTRATQMPDGSIVVEAFQTTYPSTVVSDVAILPGDTYMSHRVHGRFSFKIYYGKSRPSAAEMDGTSDNMTMNPNTDSLETPPGTETDQVDQKMQQRSTVTARSGGAEPGRPQGDRATLGRKRRNER
jgi:hypothetical protein